MMDERSFGLLLQRLKSRVRLTIGRALISLIDDKKTIQTLQLQALADEVLDDVERVQQYGFTSVPKQGAEAVVVFLGGERSAGLVVATDDRRYRVKGLQEGEVCLYTDEGDVIQLRRGNKIIVTSSGSVSVTAPTVSIEATQCTVKASDFSLTADKATLTAPDFTIDTPVLKVTGDILDKSGGGGKTMAAMRSTYNSHTHPENNKDGGSTSAPNEGM